MPPRMSPLSKANYASGITVELRKLNRALAELPPVPMTANRKEERQAHRHVIAASQRIHAAIDELTTAATIFVAVATDDARRKEAANVSPTS